MSRSLSIAEAERRELARPSPHSRPEAMEALMWAYQQGGRDAVEALLGGEMRPRDLRSAPRSARRMNAEGQRIAERLVRLTSRRPTRSRGVGRPARRPRAQSARSSAKSGDSPSDDDPEPPAAEPLRWADPASWRAFLADGLTFEALQAASCAAGLRPDQRLKFFHALPEYLRAQVWQSLEAAKR